MRSNVSSSRGDPEIQKIKTFDAGVNAESRASRHITELGGEIIGNRVRNNQGEIDVISVYRGVVSFTEVKHRKSFDEGLCAVSEASWARIARAAETFMASRPDLDGLDWRYDLIVQNAAGELQKITDAWRPDFP